MYVYHPGSQEDVVSSWEPAHSLVEDAISGTEIIACLSASGQGGAGMQLALHWYSLNPLCYGQARLLVVRLEPFAGKFSFLHLWLGRYSVCCFFLPVMLPSEIPKLPTDPPVRGFPTVWKLLLLHDSLPRTSLRP